MPRQNYLEHLNEQLAQGLARLPMEFRARHAGYLRGKQNSDGGFSGREGGSDLYYTGFALRGLAVLGELTPEVCERAADFLRQCLAQQTSVIDFFSFLYSCLLVQLGGGSDVLAGSPHDWPERVATTLETFRTADGGYAKNPGASSGSTYHTFLLALCYQLLGRDIPQKETIRKFVLSRRREDGGFVEIAPMRRSGTNPTAAAVGLLQLVDGELATEVKEGVIRLLAEMPSLEGGLRANGRAPLADLLSTFTGSWTLAQLGERQRIDDVAVLQFARSLEVKDGGFRGGLWDEQCDVEYTFYGMGIMALLT